MGLLNHLFGGKKGLARELEEDSEKRYEIWKEFVSSHEKRKDLVKNFNYANADNTIKGFS